MKAVIVDRIETRPNWSPARLEDVSVEIVAKFFEPKSPYLTMAPEVTIPAELTSGTKVNPAKYALPSEEEIGSAVTGSKPSGQILYDDLLKKFMEQQPGKIGVKEKILEVVQRRCEVKNDGNRVWLTWRPLASLVLV